VLKIRLRRTGARKRPSYRVVVAEATAPRDGRYIEILGTYDPLTDPATIKLDGDRAKHWLSVGAQPTDRVVKLLAREGLMAPPVYARPASIDAAIQAAAEHTVATTDASDQSVAEEETAEAIEE
jgi:small subunit ribosomal protein S16